MMEMHRGQLLVRKLTIFYSLLFASDELRNLCLLSPSENDMQYI